MARPADFGLTHGGADAREADLLQHLTVGNLVLPADLEDTAKTPVMELLELFFVSPVDGPSFRSVQKVWSRLLPCKV